jgi:hypothetical protein
MDSPLPDEFLRGIPNPDFVNATGSVGTHLFYFKPEHARADGWTEQSICWRDDEQALRVLLSQTKDGVLQFGSGAAVLDREAIDALAKAPQAKDKLSHERSPLLPHNPYHGNLLLRTAVPDRTMKQIAAAIALCVTRIER